MLETYLTKTIFMKGWEAIYNLDNKVWKIMNIKDHKLITLKWQTYFTVLTHKNKSLNGT